MAFIKVPNYTFSGNPVSQAAAAKVASDHLKAQGQIDSAQANANGQIGAAQATAQGTLYGQPGNIYGNYADAGSRAFGGYAQGLGQISGSLAGLYNSYGNNLQNLYSNQTSAMGQTEAARQIAAANIGSAGLSSMGQMMGGAFGAQAQNQSAAYKAMADMAAANQGAMSSYGASQNSALANLGGSAATLGGSGANAYSQLGTGLSGSRASAAGQLGSAYGNALTGLGQSASSLGTGIANAGAGMYGTLGTAAGGLGSATNTALANMYGVMSGNNLGAYNTNASYQADMAKLGLARELGLGQIGVAGNAFGGGGGYGGGVSMSASGSPLGGSYASGGYGGGQSVYGMPYGYGSPSGYGGSSSPAWYQDPQMLSPYFDPAMMQGGGAIRNNTNSALGAMNGYGYAGGQTVNGAGRQGFGQLGALSNLAQNIPGMYSSAMSGIDRDSSNAYGGIGSSLSQGYGAINQSRNDINSSPIASYLMQSNQAGRDQLDGSMRTNNRLLSNWVNAGLGNMQSAMASGYGQLNNGMDQFYANIPRDGAGLLGSALQQGASQVNAFGSQLGSAYGNFNNSNNAARQNAFGQLGDIMDRTGLMTPLAQQQMRFKMQDAQNARNAQIAQQRYATIRYGGAR